MKPSLLRSYLLISLGITAIFILIGIFAIELINQINRRQFENNPPEFFGRFVDNAAVSERGQIVAQMRGEIFPYDVWIIDRAGQIIERSSDRELPAELKQIRLPQVEMKLQALEHSFWQREPATVVMKLHGMPEQFLVFAPRPLPFFQHDGPPDLPPPPVDFAGVPLGERTHDGSPPAPPHGLPPGPPPNADGHGMIFRPPGPPGLMGSRRNGFHPGLPFLFPIAILIVAMLLASALSVMVLFMYLKRTSILADSVLNALKSGDLKARFPATKMNEIGNLMYRFNLMADEIENLFNQLKQKEQSRTRLLQELAHDLRTPIASMQNNLSLLSGEQGSVAADTRNELLAVSQKEASYIEQLVNDLLMLSQISGVEPAQNKNITVDLGSLIESELDAQTLGERAKIKVTFARSDVPVVVSGDPLLLHRAFRNLLDNAFSFARQEVTVEINRVDGRPAVTVCDDGPGFSLEALQNYGERRSTRFVGEQQAGRISIGLGSVIVKTIALLHGAQVTPTNRIAGGRIVGAEVKIQF